MKATNSVIWTKFSAALRRSAVCAIALCAVLQGATALAQVSGVRAAELRVFRREELIWVAVDSQSVDTTRLILTASLNKLGVYTVMGEPASAVSVTPQQVAIDSGATTQLSATVRSG